MLARASTWRGADATKCRHRLASPHQLQRYRRRWLAQQNPWWKPQGSGRTQAVRAALELVKLTNMAYKAPAELSGGQRQRLLIARTLVQGGKVLLLDEPLSGLDAGARRDLGNVLRDVCEREGTSIIVASHEVEHFPLRFDRDLHFHQGGLVNTHDIHCEVVGDAH